MGKNKRKTNEGHEETYTYDEMNAFIKKWEHNHEKSRTQYILLRVITPAAAIYLVVAGFIAPFLISGFSFSYISDMSMVLNIFFIFLLACGCAYYVGGRIWAQNEEKYRLFETVLDRYGSAWEWVAEEQQKSREAERLRREKLNKGNKKR